MVDGAVTFPAQQGHDTAAREIGRQFCELQGSPLGCATHLQQLLHIAHRQKGKRFQDGGAAFVGIGAALEDAGKDGFGLSPSITARISFSDDP